MVLMRAFATGKSFLFVFTSLQLLSGLANDESSEAKHESKQVNDGALRTSTGLRVILICLALVTVIALGVILMKLWQRKKREEQQARLLKLFEDDDELEVELGMQE
ncbi:hypothetical protein VNO77_25758 [Canavalia gladiata]|uniref:Uncharacterized protein n=1 Tax=Canavalia gladiata TaxID=3824 RepID=A0AAN9KS22_CANGL